MKLSIVKKVKTKSDKYIEFGVILEYKDSYTVS